MAIVVSPLNGWGGLGMTPTLRLVFLVVLDHFADDEVQEVSGEFGVEIGFACETLKPLDLLAFSQRIGGGQVVLCLEHAHGLRVLEPLGQRVDEHGIEAVDTLAVPFEKFGGELRGISHGTRLSVWKSGSCDTLFRVAPNLTWLAQKHGVALMRAVQSTGETQRAFVLVGNVGNDTVQTHVPRGMS